MIAFVENQASGCFNFFQAYRIETVSCIAEILQTSLYHCPKKRRIIQSGI